MDDIKDLTEYYDLTKENISELSIVETSNQFNCMLIDQQGNVYKGFLLAKSEKGNNYTICDIDFQRSDTDKKYHPRITFRRTNKDLLDIKVRKDVHYKNIDFSSGDNGYREFWSMIGFLKKCNDLIDTGDFKEKFKAISGKDFAEYLNDKQRFKKYSELEKSVDSLNIPTLEAFQAASIIKILESYKSKLEEFIDNAVDEKVVQQWLDEKNGELRNKRCLVFGLEYIQHKREGSISGMRYDILTRIGAQQEERVLIELKSPSDEVIDFKERKTINGISREFFLSKSLSRAIPQILEYKNNLDNKKSGDRDLERFGEKAPIYIAKCIIVIGKDREDQAWRNRLKEVRSSFNSNLEIWTYTDLLMKLDSTIRNLKESLLNNEDF
jgi:hypothetical protein